MASPALVRAGRAAATTAGLLRLRHRRLAVAVAAAVHGDAAGRDGHEAAVVAAAIAGLTGSQGGITARMRAAIAAADGALRGRSAGRSAPLTAAVSLIVAADDEVVVVEVGPTLGFVSTPDGLPARLRPTPPLGAPDDDPARPPLGRPGAVEPILHWARFEPADYPRGLVVVAATPDAAAALSDAVVAALYATPADRWPTALAVAVPPEAAAMALAFPPPRGPAARPTRGAAAPAEASPARAGGIDVVGVRGAVDAPAGPVAAPAGPAGSDAQRAARARATASATTAAAADRLRAAAAGARRSAGAVPWRRYGAAIGRGAARLFLALLPRRLAARDPAEWAVLLASAAVVLPILALVAALAILARAPGGLGAGFDRAGRGAAPAATRAPAAPIQIAPPAGDAVSAASAGTGSVVSATVPVATLPPHDPTLDAGMVRLPDAAGVARFQGGAADRRQVVAHGDMAYVLNAAARVVEASTAAGVLPVLQAGTVVGGEPVGELLDLAWLPLPGGDGGQVVALDAAGRLWAIDGVAARPLAVEGGLAEGTRAIAGLDGALFGVDRAHGITRYAAAPGPSFAAGAAWLDTAADLSDALDLAVAASVVVLRPGGIDRFAAGVPAAFDTATVPGGLAGAAALFASADANRILVADPARGRIVALAEDGTFRAQHALPILPAAAPDSDDARGRIRSLQGVFWDTSDASLWWLSGPELYRSPFRP